MSGDVPNPPPIPPSREPLPYSSPQPKQGHTGRTIVESVAGFLAFVGTVAIVISMMLHASNGYPLLLLMIPVVGAIIYSSSVRRPAAVIGMFLALGFCCIAPLAICGLIIMRK
jgi:hypothetical protein